MRDEVAAAIRFPKTRVATVLTVLVVVAASGCGLKKEKNFDGIACGEADQYHTYMNPMDSTVVQSVTLDSKFSDLQVSKIEHAIATWNAYGRRITGHDLFRAQRLALSASSAPVPSDNCGFAGTSTAFSVVRMDSSESWSALGFDKSNPGVTVRCSGGIDFAAKQVVLLNTLNMDDALFESVILHELGHAIGLDHSCIYGSSGSSQIAGCPATLSTTHPYVEAVMHPMVSASNPKEDLRANDEERAACALNYRPDEA